MRKGRRIEIMIETSRQLVIRHSGSGTKSEPVEERLTMLMSGWQRDYSPTEPANDHVRPPNSTQELRPQPQRQPELSGCRPSRGERKKRGTHEINVEAFNAVLALLDADRERAGRRYLLLRQKLIKFFECRGCLSATDLADETFDRVARRVHTGETIRASEPERYFYGVARNILREHRDSPERQFVSLDDLDPGEHPCIEPQQHIEDFRRQHEFSLDCLAHCLQALSADSRNLLFDYYLDEKRARIARRKRTAERLGITVNALKIRVYRIRARLEARISEMRAQFPED